MQAFAGRLLFAAIFISSALQRFQTFGTDGGPTVAYMKPKMTAFKNQVHGATGLSLDVVLPLEDKHYLAVATALELLGGILFVLGSDLGAKLLLLFLVPVTFIMHDFWTIKDTSSQAHMIEMINFFKNVAMIGALLTYLALKHDLRQAAIASKLKTH